MRPILISILLLSLSNIFMTFAWYAHLKELNHRPWFVAALISWGIAFFEYALQVPANRIGYTVFSVAQLKKQLGVNENAVFMKVDGKIVEAYLDNSGVRDISPLSGLPLRRLMLMQTEVKDIAPVAGMPLEELSLFETQVADISPLKGLTEWKYLFLDGNKLTELGVLIEMGKADKEGSQRFAPFWNIYLKGNPLSDEAKKTQLDELKKYARTVVYE